MNAYEWRDGYGRMWWQPMLDDGRRRWITYSFMGDKLAVWAQRGGGYEPKVYRSRARAERVARRHQRRLDHAERSKIKPLPRKDKTSD